MLIARLVPRSLLGRLTIVMVLGVLVAQLIANLIWAQQIRQQAEGEAAEAALHLGGSAAAAIRFFKSLPTNYRPLLIEQLREMGGTRFYVNVNSAPVPVTPIEDTELSHVVLETVRTKLREELPRLVDYRVAFAWPDGLPVSNDGVTLQDLPDDWVQHTLIVRPRPAPVLVIQAELESSGWVYLAALMPDPYFLDSANPITLDRVGLQLVTLLAVLLLSVSVVGWLTRPLAELAAAAKSFGQGARTEPVAESGSREFVQTARAFNAMQARIQRYIDDRERLFSSISHDLRTPITRLKLRTELLDDDAARADFHEDLDELELMVKGALQSVKDADIHENRTAVRLDLLLERLAADAKLAGHEVALAGGPVTVIAKPLALKRALSNLLDNAIKYGGRAEVLLSEQGDNVELTIRDYGPGVPDEALDTLFDPYVRLEHGRQSNQSGMGLGLGIARNIIHAHGGELLLTNHPDGGLVARVLLIGEAL
ncbi:two-component sensor histidine kinase [Chitiniphilus shinanonensis]|uniref:histidine kinase n=1 Tax=Chitiniphilus shinanonensis TaxID=553088 RepID=A0ABQ6BXN6_9NEIS|nr:ATP-binding protein [Chitiniphilus shinanonensis]GLS04554.1 two-component sensor histidine kinase [Chitiniphilus shinanonensis]